MWTDSTKLLAMIVLTGAIVVSAAGVWVPHHRRASATRRAIDEQRALLRRLRAGESEAAPDVAALRRGDRPDDAVAVPAEPDLGSLLTSLGEDLAAESITVQQLEANALVEGGQLDRIPVRVRCRASYPALFNLLERIESSPRILRLDRIDVFERSGEGDPDALLSVEIELSAFSRPGAEATS